MTWLTISQRQSSRQKASALMNLKPRCTNYTKEIKNQKSKIENNEATQKTLNSKCLINGNFIHKIEMLNTNDRERESARAKLSHFPSIYCGVKQNK